MTFSPRPRGSRSGPGGPSPTTQVGHELVVAGMLILAGAASTMTSWRDGRRLGMSGPPHHPTALTEQTAQTRYRRTGEGADAKAPPRCETRERFGVRRPCDGLVVTRPRTPGGVSPPS